MCICAMWLCRTPYVLDGATLRRQLKSFNDGLHMMEALVLPAVVCAYAYVVTN